MAYDIFIIILTSFAALGVYCLCEAVINIFALNNMPVSITIMKNTGDEKMIGKIKYIEQNMPNNDIVLYPFEGEENNLRQRKILTDYVEEKLNVNIR